MQQVKAAPIRGLTLLVFLLLACTAMAAAPAGAVPAAPGAPGTASQTAMSPVGSPVGNVDPHVYTNADLEALGGIPQQKAPLVESPGWDFVFRVLDRERALEKERKDRELEQAALREEELRREQQEEGQVVGSYLYPGWGYSYPTWGYTYPGWGNSHPGGGHPHPGGGNPAHHGHQRPNSYNLTPSNPYESLSMRGIRTATDLFNESVRNSNIRRRNLP